MGGDPEPDKPVHEPATDSRTGEDETWDSPQLAAPRHRSGLDEGGLPADPQGRCSGHRWGESGRLRDDPGGQSLGPPGAHQVGPLPRPTGAPGLYSESGWHATASGYPDARCIKHLIQQGLGIVPGDGTMWQSKCGVSYRSRQ